MRSRIVLALGSVLLAMCTRDRSSTAPEPYDPRAAIVDGAHNGGSPHFYFLPPLVTDPGARGAFYGFLTPTVEICETGGDECAGPPVAVFTTELSSGSESVRVAEEDEQYIVNWHTGKSNLELTVYRVRVLLDGVELGHVDVQVVGEPIAAQRIARDGGIAVATGSTLPIKFRIVGDRSVVIDAANASLVSSETDLAAGIYRFRVSGTTPTVEAGDVIVGTEGGGFLRRAVTVSLQGAELEIHTTTTALDDIIATGSFESGVSFQASAPARGSVPLEPAEIRWGDWRVDFLARGVAPSAAGITLGSVDLCKELIPCPAGVNLTVTAGEITFDPDLDIGGRFGFFSLDEFHVIARGGLSVLAGIRAAAEAPYAISGQHTIASFSKPFTTSIGIVPIVGEVQLSFVASATASASAGVSLTSGVSGSYTVEVGARYESGDWSQLNNVERSLKLEAAEWSSSAVANVRFEVRPEIRVTFYHVAGPFLGLQPYLEGDGRLDSEGCRLQVLAGLDADLGIDVRILSANVTSLDADLAGPQAVLADIDCLPTNAWASIGAGSQFSCGLLSDGAAYCWGTNDHGQLGDGAALASTIPVAVTGGHFFDQLAVGDNFACGVEASGAAHCWGSNSSGQLGVGLPIDFATFSTTPVPVAGSHQFVNLSAGLRTACGTATDGATYCWGQGTEGLLGNGATVNSAVPVMVTGSASLGLHSVSTGFEASCALNRAGALFCWGRQILFGNGSSAFTVVPTPQQAGSGTTFQIIDAGNVYFCGLRSGGSAVCWGSNDVGELGTGSLTYALVPAPVAGGLSFASLDAHVSNNVLAHTCGVTRTGIGYCWGSNRVGQLGVSASDTCTWSTVGSFACARSPVLVNGGISWQGIAVGNEHTCGLDHAGSTYCWGRNDFGQLGDGTTTNRGTPTLVSPPRPRVSDHN